jgi:hypothetical protein|tara:strand:- start:1017 stop:1199 length:183 start_codon:yes stop_codon:yes gene_type:complete
MKHEKNLIETARQLLVDASTRSESEYPDSVNKLISDMQWNIDYHTDKLEQLVEQLNHILK